MRIHAIQTGWALIRPNQIAARKEDSLRLIRTFTDQEWAPPVPIYAWLLEHSEGLILVDTGQTARAVDPGHHPRWHPYFRHSVRFRVRRDEEIDVQLERIGISPRDVRWVVLTHLHTDHAGGIRHFPQSDVIVSSAEWRAAQSRWGKLAGYIPQHWPRAIIPRHPAFNDGPWGAFPRSMRLTSAGDVHVVQTPGHTAGQLAVSVSLPHVEIFLAGDASYTQDTLVQGRLDGVSLNAHQARETLQIIQRHVLRRPTIFLPAHDPKAANRLEQLQIVLPPTQDGRRSRDDLICTQTSSKKR